MEMEKVELNLTRKWRSKNFQEVVGQPLAVRILQNSLYLKQFFPVYLFAGQRGCGKTSTARIFAAAVNCARLIDFQQDPRKIAIPCLLCESCLAMSKGQHPDFIEIDAASHTGVDNVRNIIDASSFLPLLGSKKIYLIDEAHMLSKAAFNAFLKILEEPPMSVIFILATTDMHKILETVKSRCFQIFFDAVDSEIIAQHLETLCIAENISFDHAGLAIIAKESGGSVRDAINMLEQVRFATKKISKQAVLSILGHVDEAALWQLFEKIMSNDMQGLLVLCASLEKYELSIEHLWSQLADLVYDAMLLHYHVEPRNFVDLTDECKQFITRLSMHNLTDVFALLCSHEQHVSRTTKKLRYFEMIILHYVSGNLGLQDSKKKINNSADVASLAVVSTKDTHNLAQDRWQKFITQTNAFDDMILATMFQSAQLLTFDEDSGMVSISFLKKFTLFIDLIEKEKVLWSVILQKVFGHQATLQYNFELIADQAVQKEKQNIVSQGKVIPPVTLVQQRSTAGKVDISDPNTWKLAHALMKHFDGTIIEMSRDTYE